MNEAVLGLASALNSVSQLKPLIAVTSWTPIQLPLQIRGIPVVGVQLHDGYDTDLLTAVKSGARLPSDLTAILSSIRTHNVKVVNIHFPSLGGALFPLLRRMGLYEGKVALTFHGSDIRYAASTTSIKRMAWKMYIRSVDIVITCSKQLATQVEALCPGQPVEVIYNGADIEAFSSVLRTRGPGPRRILHVGKYEENKSHDVLLEALQLLLARRVDCTLTMIGARGAALDSVLHRAEPFGARARVLVDIPHQDIPQYMAECDVFVLPSRAEGLPIVLIEAGAAALPVVATEVGGIPEIITNGSSGILVQPNNATSLANALQRVLQNDELAATLGTELRSQAQRFTWKRAAHQFVAVVS